MAAKAKAKAKASVRKLEEVLNFTEMGGSVRVFTDALGCKQMELAIGFFKPGEGLKRHLHKTPSEEIYFVYKGKGTVYYGDQTVQVSAGTALQIPPEVDHGVTNTGKEPLEIVFVTAPIQKQPMVITG